MTNNLNYSYSIKSGDTHENTAMKFLQNYEKKRVISFVSIVIVIILVLITSVLVLNTKHSQTTASHAAAVTQATSFLPGSVPGCQFQKADTGFNVAFCDTFDQPMGTGNRSGDLDGLVWGASRLSDGWNQGQGQYNLWHTNQMDKCGVMQTVTGLNDIQICNGEMVETTSNDGGEGGEVELAMYPKQPFDIAGRTGTVVFDVTADSQGPHAAWPSFMYTDQPVPAPITSISPPNINTSTPRNGFGIVLDGYGNTADNQFIDNCPNNNDTSVGEMFVVRNYVLSDISFNIVGCVKRPNTPGSQLNSDSSHLGSPLNHFEIRISQSTVTVWGTDPGSTTLQELAVANNVNLPLTRGLIWIGDGRYNASKFNDQATHTFGWDNVGFDGPVLPRDAANDVNDANSTGNLGWGMFNTGSLQVPNVTGVSQATGALLTMNWHNDSTVGSFNYRLNGNAWHTQAWPYDPSQLYAIHTLGIPVPLSEVVNGTNKIDFDFSGISGSIVANVDLILVGGQGMPSCYDPSNCAGSQFSSGPTATPGGPTLTPTLQPTHTPTPSPTPTPNATGTTLGNTNKGANIDSGDANFMNGTKITTGSTPATVVSLSVNVGTVDTAPSNQYQMAIYTDSSGVPGTLVAKTAIGTLTANSWNTLTLTTTLAANTAYWLIYNTNGSTSSVNNMFFDTAASQIGAFSNNTQPFGSFPTTFGAATLGTENFSIYASLSGGSVTPSPTPTLTVTPTAAPITISYNLLSGWNSFSLPVTPTGGAPSAQNFLQALLNSSGGGYAEIDAYDAGQFKPSAFIDTTDGIGFGGTAFTLVPGQGYIVRMDKAGSYTTSGTPLQSMTFNLVAGYTLISTPIAPNGKNASDLYNSVLAAGGTQVEVNKVDNATGTFVPYVPSTGANNFNLSLGEAYAVYTATPITWNASTLNAVPTITVTPVTTPAPTIPLPTPQITSTPSPSPVSPTPISTKLALTLGLDGIGKAGDNVSRTSTGNTSPLHPQRNVTLILSDQNNNPLPAITGQVSYDSVSGLFKGTIALPSTVVSGVYTLKASTPSFLLKAIPGILTLTQGQTTTVPTTDLTAGDINNDNQISLLDYNQILSCFGSSTSTCIPSDLDDDGTVGGSDYNLFLRELSVQIGG